MSFKRPGDYEPALVTSLREQLRRAEEQQRADDRSCATIVGLGVKRLGIHPKLLAVNPDGSKVYSLTVKQVRKVLANYDAHCERPLA